MMLTIENQDRLKEFVSEVKQNLSQVVYEGDYSYAGDGQIVTRIKERYSNTYESDMNLSRFFERFSKSEPVMEITSDQIEEIIIKNLKDIECEACDGKGYYFSKECPECFGNGVFQYRQNGNTSWNDCGNCDNNREVLANAKDWNRIIRACECCSGSRYNWNFRIRMAENSDIFFRTIKKLFSVFRKIELLVLHDQNLQPIGFKSGSFEGLVMPLHPAESKDKVLNIQKGVFE